MAQVAIAYLYTDNVGTQHSAVLNAEAPPIPHVGDFIVVELYGYPANRNWKVASVIHAPQSAPNYGVYIFVAPATLPAALPAF